MTSFSLDPRIEADTVPVVDLGLSTVRLMNDSNYPWLVLVPRRPGLVELLDLSPVERAVLIEEVAAAGEALRNSAPCHKLNVAALGNMVPQLHVHVIARLRTDAAWPGPVWGVVPAAPWPEGARDALVTAVRGRLRRG